MGTLSRYLYKQTSLGLILAFTIIISLVILIDFVELSRQFGSFSQVSTLSILYLSLLKMPGVLEQTLPFIVLFGVMWSMFRLNRRSELIAMRAAGYSAWRFVAPPTIIALILGVLSMTALNPAVAALNEKFETERVKISRSIGAPVSGNQENIWMREATETGALIIMAKDTNPQTAELLKTTFYFYHLDETGTPVFENRIDAKSAILKSGFWKLENAFETRPRELPIRHQTFEVPTDLDTNTLLKKISPNQTNSFWSLPQMIKNARAANLDSSRFELQWGRLLSLPLTLAAMAIIGASFSFRLSRLGGAFGMMITAGAIGFFLYFAGDLLEALGATRVLPPLLASWAAPAFIFFAGLARITIIEDG